MRKAIELDPNYADVYTYGTTHYFMNDFDTSVENIQITVDRNPSVISIRTALSSSLAMGGRQDDAEWQIEQLYSMGFSKTLDEFINEEPIVVPTYRALYREGLKKDGLS